ncbi:MAG: sodium/proton-translocating pyrophosphatase, partial [Pseudomonadota bacterium]|nr:sodium/proton-translocating pyrophosphatase [Pseudomonadota bacterium]
MLQFVIACGVIAVLYGIFASRSILAASAGTERMQEIAGAIQEGAKAYLDRQYRTIGLVGIVVAVILFFTLGSQAAIGFLIGAILSGAAGYVGMLISVRANVRTTEASRQGLAQGLSISFKSGAVTGMLVAGFALLAISIYYGVLNANGSDDKQLINGLIGLAFGASLISIFARLGGGGIITRLGGGGTRARSRRAPRLGAIPSRRAMVAARDLRRT